MTEKGEDSLKRNASYTAECTGGKKKREEIIVGNERIIDELRETLKEKDNEIKCVSEKYEKIHIVTSQFDAQKGEYEKIISEKEATITSLLTQLKEKDDEHQTLVKNMENNEKRHMKAIAEKDIYIKEVLKKVDHLQNVTKSFLGPMEDITNLTEEEKDD